VEEAAEEDSHGSAPASTPSDEQQGSRPDVGDGLGATSEKAARTTPATSSWTAE